LPPIDAVSVVGLGKLGAPIAACFAARGFDVIGVDADQTKVAQVNQGEAPVHESGLPDLLAQTGGRLRATMDLDDAVLRTPATFLVVPTPSDSDGSFSLVYVDAAIDALGAALARKDSYHLVVLTSTVLPGATEQKIVPRLERVSGRRCGQDFGFCYSPEFVALGSVIKDFLEPDFLLIGESDAQAGDALAQIYKRVCEGDPPVARMGFANAELAKLAVNTFVTTKISFANMLATLCEKLPGGDVDAVTHALGLDSRIGPRYLKGALPYGGPCFPRDNVALAHLGRLLDAPASLAGATDAFNHDLLRRLADAVERAGGPNAPVAILGLAYKPGTNVVDEAPGVLLADMLVQAGRHVTVHDPLAMSHARRTLGNRVKYAPTWREALSQDGVVVLINIDPAFREIAASDLVAAGVEAVVDPWRAFRNAFDGHERLRYVGIGLASESRRPVAV